MHFNPRSPSGLRQYFRNDEARGKNISIHAARVGCDKITNALKEKLNTISIHAARVGCDRKWQTRTRYKNYISIHAARVGCDPCGVYYKHRHNAISIHAARVGCDTGRFTNRAAIDISIHAARVGCDKPSSSPRRAPVVFQSTQPEWAATAIIRFIVMIQIFQSTQPEWAATPYLPAAAQTLSFQSTQPEWAATFDNLLPFTVKLSISIHAARVGCDLHWLCG